MAPCLPDAAAAYAVAGCAEFDKAFRATCTRLFPDHDLTRLPSSHPLFRSFYEITELRVNHEQDPIAPQLLTITLGDRPAIIYSPLGLSDGWARQFSAYARAYATPDALKLGTNIVIFAMQ